MFSRQIITQGRTPTGLPGMLEVHHQLVEWVATFVEWLMAEIVHVVACSGQITVKKAAANVLLGRHNPGRRPMQTRELSCPLCGQRHRKCKDLVPFPAGDFRVG